MSPGATFDRIYLALKQRLASGALRAGDPLEPAHLSEELAASITPIRDALHRLAGERLVEAPKNDGFRVPLISELGLRHLYAWNAELLALAVRANRPHAPRPEPPDLMDAPAAQEAPLFAAIAKMSGNREHAASVSANNDRLAPVRLVEAQLLSGTPGELAAIAAAFDAADLGVLRTALARYHRRRIRATPDIVAALHAPD
jgi:hypothetical protein